jgi:micrococcal nuclease
MVSKSKIFYFIFSFFIFLLGSVQAAEYRQCIRVVDGDTIILDGNEKVRLIGVDTPETVHPSKPVQFFGKEASAFTKRMVEGKNVRLEYDWQRSDKYGRTLAYVYLEDGTFLNAEIIKQGYGHAYTIYPFKYLEDFRKYEQEARENGQGLWAENSDASTEKIAQGEGNKSPPTSDQTVYITKTGSKYHSENCRYLSKSKIPISLKDAVLSYSPCSVCNPPTIKNPSLSPRTSESATVYVTRTGAKYHRAGCRFLRRSAIPISLEEAKKHYSPCSVCRPPQ